MGCLAKSMEDGAKLKDAGIDLTASADFMRRRAQCVKSNPNSVAASIVEFSRFLRSHGLSAGTSQTLTALEAAKAIDSRKPANLLLCPAVDAVLHQRGMGAIPGLIYRFWRESRSRPRSASGEHMGSSRSNTQERDDSSAVFLDQPGNQAAAQDGIGKAVYGASTQQRLKKVDFSEVPCDDLAALEELSLRLLRRMSLRRSRRLAINTLAERVDLRRSIRRSIMRGGEPIVLAYKARKPRKNRLVVFLDISGSMNFYSMFLVRFAYALQAHFERVHTFLFSTNVVEISDLLRTTNLPDALRRLSQRAAGWSSGTKIGESLLQFNQRRREGSCSLAIPFSLFSATAGIQESRRCWRRRCALSNAAYKKSCG